MMSNFQIRLEIEAILKTVLKTKNKILRAHLYFLGPIKAPMHLSSTMNDTLAYMLNNFMASICNEILTHSKTWKKHFEHL